MTDDLEDFGDELDIEAGIVKDKREAEALRLGKLVQQWAEKTEEFYQSGAYLGKVNRRAALLLLRRLQALIEQHAGGSQAGLAVDALDTVEKWADKQVMRRS